MPKTRQKSKQNTPTIPAEFRILEAGGTTDFRLLEAAADDRPQLRRFTMTAYTGGRMNLATFPFPVVADLSGMRVPSKNRPILRDRPSLIDLAPTILEAFEIDPPETMTGEDVFKTRRSEDRTTMPGTERTPVAATKE